MAITRSVLLLCLLLDLTLRPASAYLDPGTGSQAFQIGLAGLLGLAFTFRGGLARLMAGLRGGRRGGAAAAAKKTR